MDCSRLKLAIPCYRVSEDGSTFCYCNTVVYGKLKWEVLHRFSDYHCLYDKLKEIQLEGLHSPPPKLLGRPNNSIVLEERRFMLESWLRALAIRPDIRTSNPFVEFIEFEIHTNCNVQPLAPSLEASHHNGRFQLTDFQWVGSQRSIVAAYDEGPSMARLGKVWSIIEKEESGALSIFGLPLTTLSDSDSAIESLPSRLTTETVQTVESIQSFDALLHTNTVNRCRALFYHEGTGRIFVGLESGVVEVYRQARSDTTLPHPSPHEQPDQDPSLLSSVEETTFYGLINEEQLHLHSESVLSIRGTDKGPGRLLTVGFDKAVRVINCTTLETLCGGKLNKRLDKGQQLTTGVLEDVTNGEDCMKDSRMFIGASNGSVFVFSTSSNPPQHLHTIVTESEAHPVTALELAGSSLLVARKYSLSIYRVGKPNDKMVSVNRIALYEPQLKTGATIRSIAVARTSPLLFLGHTRAISIYDVREGVPISIFNAHFDGVRRLRVLENGEQQSQSKSQSQTKSQSQSKSQSRSTAGGTAYYEQEPPPLRYVQLLSGGGDGALKLWTVQSVNEMRLWKHTENSTAQPSSERHGEPQCPVLPSTPAKGLTAQVESPRSIRNPAAVSHLGLSESNGSSDTPMDDSHNGLIRPSTPEGGKSEGANSNNKMHYGRRNHTIVPPPPILRREPGDIHHQIDFDDSLIASREFTEVKSHRH